MLSAWLRREHRGSILASHPAALGSIPGIPENFSLEFFYVAVGFSDGAPQSDQRLENVNQTHLVLASGTLQKIK